MGAGGYTAVPRGSELGDTLSQASSHTPMAPKGQRVDKTTFKHKHGFSDTFSHTQTHLRAGPEGQRVDYNTLNDPSFVFLSHTGI